MRFGMIIRNIYFKRKIVLSRYTQFYCIHKEYNIYKDIAEVIIEKGIIETTFDQIMNKIDHCLKGK